MKHGSPPTCMHAHWCETVFIHTHTCRLWGLPFFVSRHISYLHCSTRYSNTTTSVTPRSLYGHGTLYQACLTQVTSHPTRIRDASPHFESKAFLPRSGWEDERRCHVHVINVKLLPVNFAQHKHWQPCSDKIAVSGQGVVLDYCQNDEQLNTLPLRFLPIPCPPHRSTLTPRPHILDWWSSSQQLLKWTTVEIYLPRRLMMCFLKRNHQYL